MKITVLLLSVVVGTLFTLASLFTAGWERPPMESQQLGYRGLGMEQITNPRLAARTRERNALPDPIDPVEPGGPLATTEYTNIQVLTDLTVDQFNRNMLAITQWVAPEQGCGYCHNEENLASDEKYTKVVARRMLQMNRHINADWKSHVAETGVTCYTCHRGQPVPAQVWFDGEGLTSAAGMSASRQGQNIASRLAGLSSLPYNPLKDYLRQRDGQDSVRVVSTTALPDGNPRNIKDTEETYGLMIHLSEALGVNCTFCHNTRSFASWDQSTPQRTTAFHGIQMVRDINSDYLEPLQSVFPANRLGPLGDVAKANCATCHQGVSKPLFGMSMAKDFPELTGPAAVR